MTVDLARMRLDYETRGIDRSDLVADPVEQFRVWLQVAVDAELEEPNAMVVSTVDTDGQPWSRYVLLKGLTAAGFEFYTNYESNKSTQLAAAPRAAVTFGWLDLHRQVNIAGTVERLPAERSDEYWAVRTRGSQVGGWASLQSSELDDRAQLLDAYDRFEQDLADPVPRPPHWGGWLIRPHTVEFWQGRRNRLHDRFRYLLEDDGSWRIVRLSP